MNRRANPYRQRVLAELAKQLSKEFGKGFTACNLRNVCQFYQTFSQEEICDALRSNLIWTDTCRFYLGFPILSTTWGELRWSHVMFEKDSVISGRKNKSPTLKKGARGVMKPYNPALKPFSRNLSTNMTDAELLLWSKLRRKQLLDCSFIAKNLNKLHRRFFLRSCQSGD
jgi:hypothetical protein